MRLTRCDWGWGGGGGRDGRGGEGTGNLTAAVTGDGEGGCMAPSQQSSGKQWSRLMIHSLIVMAPTERMGTRRSSLEINSQEAHEY